MIKEVTPNGIPGVEKSARGDYPLHGCHKIVVYSEREFKRVRSNERDFSTIEINGETYFVCRSSSGCYEDQIEVMKRRAEGLLQKVLKQGLDLRDFDRLDISANMVNGKGETGVHVSYHKFSN